MKAQSPTDEIREIAADHDQLGAPADPHTAGPTATGDGRYRMACTCGQVGEPAILMQVDNQIRAHKREARR